MKKYLFLLLVLAGLAGHEANAQNQLVLYNMHRSLPQANYLNPAFVPASKINIGLPGLSSNQVGFNNGQLAFRDIFRYEGDSLVFVNSEDDEDLFLSKLDDVNNIDFTADVTLLYVGIGSKKGYFTASVRQRAFSTANVTRDLVGWVLKGPGSEQYINSTLNANDLFVNATSYAEAAVSYSFPITEKLQIGLRGKMLFGQFNINTASVDAQLYTGVDSASLAVNDLLINTTGIDVDDPNFSEEDVLTSFGNTGVGFDIGATYEVNDRLTLNAAFNYNGSITWSEFTKSFAIQDASYTFTGFDALDLINNQDTIDGFFEQERQKVEDAFDFTEESNINYTTNLPSTAYIGANLKVIEGHYAGAVLHGTFIDGEFSPAVNLSYNLMVKKFLNMVASASLIDGQLNNLGAGFSINGGPVQFYLMSDNMLSWFYPSRAKVFDARFGINLTFGRVKNEVAQF